MGFEAVDWIYLVVDRVQWRSYVDNFGFRERLRIY
jgi:hypothetical protein